MSRPGARRATASAAAGGSRRAGDLRESLAGTNLPMWFYHASASASNRHAPGVPAPTSAGEEPTSRGVHY
jgi:hypothetical protein